MNNTLRKKLVLIPAVFLLLSLLAVSISHQYSDSPVRLVEEFWRLCLNEKFNDAEKLTSNEIRLDEDTSIKMKVKKDGEVFDYTKRKEIFERKIEILKITEIKSEKYKSRIVMETKDKHGLKDTFSVCLSKSLNENKWKINYVSQVIDDEDLTEFDYCLGLDSKK